MSLFRKEKIHDPQIHVSDSSLLSTTANAGSATLPANPVGFVIITVSGTQVKVPYYAV